jgi:hypothetical protein
MPDERHPRFNSFVTSEGHAKRKGRKRMSGSDASESQCAQCAHVAMHFTRSLLCCHELLSIRILTDNNSATILFHTRVANCSSARHYSVYKDTTLQCLEEHVRTRHYSV